MTLRMRPTAKPMRHLSGAGAITIVSDVFDFERRLCSLERIAEAARGIGTVRSRRAEAATAAFDVRR